MPAALIGFAMAMSVANAVIAIPTGNTMAVLGWTASVAAHCGWLITVLRQRQGTG